MEKEEMKDFLMDLLYRSDEVRSIKSFEDACLLTMDEGLVVGMADGSEFQITIVKSR